MRLIYIEFPKLLAGLGDSGKNVLGASSSSLYELQIRYNYSEENDIRPPFQTKKSQSAIEYRRITNTILSYMYLVIDSNSIQCNVDGISRNVVMRL